MHDQSADGSVYYVHPKSRIIQPEARRSPEQAPADITARQDRAIRFTSDQYHFLTGCLIRRERTHAAVVNSERRARALLAILCSCAVAFLFANPGSVFDVEVAGITSSFALMQVTAVFPLLVTFASFHALRMSATRRRLNAECQIIEAEIRRFGCHTSYSLLERFRATCEGDRNTYAEHEARRLAKAVQNSHGTFILASVIVTYGGALYIAFKAFSALKPEDKDPAIFFGYLIYMTCGAALLTLAAFKNLRAQEAKKKVVNAYLERLPSADLEELQTT